MVALHGPGPETLFQELPVPRHAESTLTAIKQAVDIVALVGDYLTLHRSGSKFKALCPFHDDHNPSLELNPERQSYKCWSCGAGGDIFDFVQNYERVDFPEALRMLAERAGVALDEPSSRTAASASGGSSKSELLEVLDWAARMFVEALARDAEANAYVARRGITAESITRFGLGLAPDQRGWLQGLARREGIGPEPLEQAGLIVRNPESGLTRDRFRGRLIFPIRDLRGRPIGFGGRILPDAEKRLTELGQGIAKYINSPETSLFQKRRNLYAADLARGPARTAGWIAVVEGYTDVIAAHQAGLPNVVGTLGTALGDDHVTALRRLADRVVLVFDGDEAGQSAADRSLRLFLGHEVDVRVLTLPAGLDPADFLGQPGGVEEFRTLVEQADDPLEFTIDRAASRFDFASPEGARQAAEWVLTILAEIPRKAGTGLDLKVAKALDTLARRLAVPVESLRRELSRLRRRSQRPAPTPAVLGEPGGTSAVSENQTPIRTSDLDPIDRELVELVLNAPELVGTLITRVTADSLRDAPLRAILQACYDLHGEGQLPTFDRMTLRLEDPAVRSLAAGLLLPFDPLPLHDRMKLERPGAQPAPWTAGSPVC